jgi:transmembrane sensor
MSANSQKLPPDVIHQAGQWVARMWSDRWSEAEQQACDSWRAADPVHELAWRRMLDVTGELFAVPRDITHRALVEQPRRRTALRSMGLLLAMGGLTALWRHTGDAFDASDHQQSSMRTGTGEVRHAVLSDGTRIALAADSAVDVLMSANRRLLVLRHGQLYVETAQDKRALPRPFEVLCDYGTVRPLGTRFDVSQHAGQAQANVYQGAIIITPLLTPDQAVTLQAGQGARFSASAILMRERASTTSPDWIDGKLVAQDMRLEDLLAELSRYRSGVLRCDEAIRDIRVTGVFQLHDSDRSLANLAEAMQLKLSYYTRYLVVVSKA